MKLEILSLKEALEYIPNNRAYGIRIFNSRDYFNHDLIESENWVGIEKYFFDDVWTVGWNEYSWVDTDHVNWNGVLKTSWADIKRRYPKMTKESLMGLLEARGTTWGVRGLFNEEIAGKILDDFDRVRGDVDSVVVHCNKGENRSPAVGIALNDIYGLGIGGLEKRHPFYRRFVCDVMMRAAENSGRIKKL